MSNVKSNYISCIKINNVPILPPLITAEKSREFKKIKAQAIKIEKRICREKELRLLINEYTNSVITEQTEKVQTQSTEKKPARNLNKPRLSCDIQSSQYINNECYVFDPKESNFRLDLDNSRLTDKDVSVLHVVKDSSPKCSHIESQSFNDSSESWLKKCDQSVLNGTRIVSQFVYNGDKIERTLSNKEEDVVERDNVQTPRLLRSNSYTLDAPSPALIQHLNQTITPRKKNNSLSTLNDTFEIVSDNKTDFDTSCTESELNKISDIETSDEKKLKQFIDNNVPNTQTDFLTDLTYISEPSKKHCKLQEILKNIPEAYSKKIFEMLERKEDERADPMVISAEFDEGLSKLENVSTPVENKDLSDYTIYCRDKTESFVENEENLNRTWNFDSEREEQAKIKEKAAIIITAAAKGFLVRRILKTEKIRDLIETIKDALLCAMQLHTENVETIDKSDVELHRRLIQQVSAGCYAFYDVFFNTTVEERMAIIATDRQKKKEKLLRPLSNSTIASSRSTPRGRRSMNSSFT